MYQPKQGRWINQVESRFPVGLNAYVFAGNGPVNQIEPTDPTQSLNSTAAFPFQKPTPPTPPVFKPRPPSAYCPPRIVLPENTPEFVKEKLCQDQNSWSPKDCPCPCHSTKIGRRRVTRDDYLKMLKDMKSVAANRVLKSWWVVTPEGTCVTACRGTYAVTCPIGSTGKGNPPLICLPRNLDYCTARALLIHELTHVTQRINNEYKAYSAQGGGVLGSVLWKTQCC